MDKFLIDPPDNDITIDNVTVPQESETVIPTGPPSVEPTPPVEPITVENTSIPQESSMVETGPPESVIKDYIAEPISLSILPSTEPEEPIVDESLTGETLLPLENAFVEEPVKFSWSRWILWIIILIVFIVIAGYYTIKYALNESGYLIKKNAKGYKVSLEELQSDVKGWLRGWVEGIREWNENLGSKTNQFFFRQHVDKGTFKATKYKIPKNLITPTPNPKS
jgi:uncharacterized protein YxeA